MKNTNIQLAMRRLAIILTMAITSTTGLWSRDFYWKGGTGNWSDPSMWEQKSPKTLSGTIPTSADNVFLEQPNAHIIIDVDAVFENLYWHAGKIEGKSEKTITSFGVISVKSAVSDEFRGTWVLKSPNRGALKSDVRLSGSVEVNSTGEVFFKDPLQVAGNLTLVQGSINFGAVLVESKDFIFSDEGKQTIVFNNTILRQEKLKAGKNTDRKVTNNGLRLEKALSSEPKAMTVDHAIRHYCSGTDAKITTTVTNATRPWVRYTMEWYDEDFNNVDIQTYFPAAATSSQTFTYNFGADIEAYVVWDISVYNTSAYNGAPVEQEGDFFQFYKLPDLSLGAHTITNVSVNGGNDGQIVVNASGGTLGHTSVPAPLTYTLNPGATQNSDTFSTLTAGLYDLTVSNSDQSTCPDVTQNDIEVTEPAAGGLSIDNVVGTNEAPCSNSNNGTITFTISGATGTPEYSINGGTDWQLGNVFNDVEAGSYDCRVKDDNGEETWPGGITITQPADIAVDGAPVITHVSTTGGNDGRIQVSATGPNAPLTYTITGGDFNNDGDFQNLIAGDYVVTVSDADGCPTATTGTLTVNQPTAGPLTIDSTVVRPIVCRDENNGIIRLYVSGGSLPYEYRMTSPVIGAWQASNEFTNLAAASYEFDVRDAALTVEGSGKINVINPAQLVINDVLVQNITTCHDATTGSITIDAAGGHTPYEYSIDNGTSWSDTDSFTGLGVGEYNIRVRDLYGCGVYWGNENISAPAELVINNVVKTDVTTCFESTAGTITITASGGTGTIRYSIGGSYLNNGGVFTGLLGGTYPVSVRDANLCITSYGNVTINRPPELTYTIDKTNVTGCNGDATGSITVNAVGGTGVLEYSKDGGSNWQLGNSFAGLDAGTYEIRVRDENDCTKGEAVIISEPAVVSITDTDFTHITCHDANDGTITITATGGTAPLTYAINGGYPSNNDGVFTGLSANTYQVTVTDANACPSVTSANITIVNPDVISVAGEAFTHITCNNANNGTITITGAGGTAPLTYTITGGASNQTGVFNGLAAGGYQVTISDANGCPTATSSNITINNPAVIGITGESFTQITCNNANDGTVTITASGGTAPLLYTITGGTSNGTGIFNGLSAGTYSVTVSDANECPTDVSSSFIIVNPPAITIDDVDFTQISCNGANDGTITVAASGGTGLLTYSINGGYPSNNNGQFSGLSANTYQVSVTDANGCGPTTTANIVISNPAVINITNEAFTHITCNNANNGTITITASGGTAPLLYTITGGTSNGTGVFNGLSAGTYSVTVSDANGCPTDVSSNITINNPAVISISNEQFTHITCHNANDGTITITGAGGTAPLTYTITGGASNQTGVFNGLSAGTYQVTVSDANGCPTATSSNITIVNPDGITIDDEDFTHITCNGANNGTITISTSGGTAPLTFAINGGYPTNNTGAFSGLAAGTYQVSVTDVNGCPAVTSSNITITNPAVISITNEAYTHITCNGANNGTITITGTGGTAPLLYTLTGGTSNGTGVFNGLSAGTYEVTVSDANGCPTAVSSKITIVNPAVISIANEAFTQITCFNANDGTITITGAGGTAPLTYTITGGASNQTGRFTNLSAGTYRVTVSDVNGCPTAQSSNITIVNPAGISITNEAFTNITCNNANNGTITITASGGTAPLTYTRTGGVSNQTGVFTNLTGGTYQVTVTDVNNCVAAVSSNITIVNPAVISIANQSFTNITCNGANNGTITIVGAGGTAPLTYTITGGASNGTGVFTNLSAGTYRVTVSDVNGCPAAVSNFMTIINPAAISITNEAFTHITCNNANNGTITITATGGTAPLTYTITGGTSNGTGQFTNLSAGTYQVTVSDVNGCPTATSSNITINNPAGISITNEVYTHLTCNNSNDGTISITASGGTAPLTYSINGGYPSNQTGAFVNLAGGTYQVSVTDANGCPAALSSNITIINPNPIAITNEAFTNITCNNANNGTITITASGGNAPLTYTITGGTSNGTGVFNGLAAGTYSVTVSDVNGCPTDVSSNITINNPAVISISDEDFTPITCHNANDGTITIVGAGGTAPLTYTITGGASNQTGLFTNLSAGTYQVTVSDANGCPTATSSNITIVNPDGITITDEDFTPLTCNNSNDGTITITAAGGTAPYTFSINGGYPSNQTGVFNGLSAGSYQVSVTDVNGCPAVTSSSIDILNPNPIAITNEAFTHITCNNANDGTITITASGGNAPLIYTITGGTSNGTGVFNGLAAGTYSVTVSDINGCPTAVSSNITINNPAVISISDEDFTPITCHDANDGTITITGAGGTAPLTYTITGGASNQTGLFTNLSAGTYQVTVSDANGCPTASSSNITIINPDGITITDEDFTPITCNNANDGTITITAAGGTAPYTFSINGGYPSNQTGVFTGLAAGTYQVSVTDVNGCPAVTSSSIDILNPSVISITDQSFTNITCNNANDGTITIVATGGTLPLTYSINGGYPSNNNGLFSGLSAGNYVVTVTDVNNCSPLQSSTITIVNPPAITILGTPTAFDITCNGANDGVINVKVTGGTPPYTYSINGGYPSNSDGDFSGLVANTYIVSITDDNGCGPVTSIPIVISEPAAITITGENKTDITCNNANDGTITITANGGTGTLRYTRTGGVSNTTGVFQNLAAGTYRVSVTDDNNCGPTVSSDFTIVNPPAIQITDESVVNIPCNGGGNVGEVSVTANGGTGDLTFDIGNGTPQTNNGTFTALAGGNYQVTITDANACSITSSILTVIEPAPLVVTTTDSLFSCGSLPVIEADEIFLPDGSGATYTSVIHHTDFAPGATVQTVADIESITINLEHSYAGDLTLRVVCPDGKSLLLSNKRGGGKYLGEPVRDPGDSDDQPGLGYSYIFTSSAAFTWQTVPMATYTYTDLGGTEHINKSYIPGGSYRPEGNYSSLVGCPLNGDWTLEVKDNFPIDNGYLFKWNLNFAPSTFPEGYCNGMATVGATGGTGDYTYLWSNGNTTNTITDLCADTYTVTVTDENGCSTIHNVVIEDTNIEMEVTDTTHVLCAGLPTGSATVAAGGGNAPYNYSWNTGANGPTISGLAAGWYYVTIADANLCEGYDSVEIRTLNDLQVAFSDITHAQCNSANGGSHTGSATATGSNGVGSYDYAWSSGENTQTATSLIVGWNYVTVTDDANCTKIDSVEITEPALLEITDVAITNATCNGDTDGQIVVTVTGGTGVATINWFDSNDVQIGVGATLSFRPAGDYTVRVSDANGCTIPDSIIPIEQPDVIDFDITTTPSACNNPTGGAEVVNITGGNGGETITWFDNNDIQIGVGATIPNLGLGQYSVRVEDSEGCFLVKTFEVENNSDLLITGLTWITPIACNGDCNGEVQVTVSSTAAIAGYAWSAGSVTDTETGLCGGATVSVTITDAHGCSVDSTFTVPQPDELIIDNFTITHNQCFGNNDGVATANVSGGTLNYGFVWEDSLGNTLPSVIATLDQLAPGKYFVTVTDANGCTANDSVQIAPTLPITVNVATTLATCGESNAQAILTPSNGIAPYMYNWPLPIGSTDQATVTGLAAGTYSVTVSDAINCQVVVDVTIDNDTDLEIFLTEDQAASCFQNCDGIASVTANGGQGIISFEWFNADNESIATGNQAIDLCGGETYRVVATDESGCSITEFITISQPAPLVAVAEVVSNATCYGSPTGVVNINVSGGNSGPYTYEWADGSDLASRNDLAAGDYTVTVYEGTCSTTVSFSLTQFDEISFTYTLVNSDCAEANGSIALTGIEGGSGSGYTTTWSFPGWTADSTGMSISNLAFGVYNLHIEDDLGCTRDTTFTVGNNTDLTIAGFDMIEEVSCFGASNGVVQVSATSTAGIVSYTWSTGSVSDTAQNVTGGTTVLVTVADADGCQVVGSFEIPQPAQIAITITPTHNTCFGGIAGEALAIVTGGTGTYTYNWENAEGTQISDSLRAVNLAAGRYYLTVTDENLCIMNDSIDIQDGVEIVVAVQTTPATCGLQDGSAILTPANGVWPYTYSWPEPIGTVTDSTMAGLAVRAYQVTVTDANGCSTEVPVVINGDTNITFTVEVEEEETCYNACNGIAFVDMSTVSGGVGIIDFMWINATNDTIGYGSRMVGLCGGETYSVVATDAMGCQHTETITMQQLPEFNVTLSDLSDVSCNGLSDGAVTINATGGNGEPYTFAWPDGSNAASRNDLAAGTYVVSVYDAQNCEETIDVVIIQPLPITYELSTTEPECGESNGALSVANIAGGSGTGYIVTWSHTGWDVDSVGMSITNLEAGLYVMNITDDTGCSVSESIMLQSDSDMLVEIANITHVNCAGDATGSATILVIGGTPEYDIQWSNGQSGFTITDLTAGTYTATITDAQTCIRLFDVVINENPALETNMVVTDPIVCAEDMVTSFHVEVNGGVSPYYYQWMDSEGLDLGTDPGLVDMGAGRYYVTVTDKVGCTAIDSIEVIVPESINVTFSTTETNCDTPTGTVKANVTGGISPYTYVWAKFGEPETAVDGNGTDSIYNLGVGYYILTLTDALGCEFSDTALIESNTDMEIFVTNTVSVTCLGRNDGQATLTINLGQEPFTVIWANGDTLENVTDRVITNTQLFQGEQLVKVIDAHGCEQVRSFIVPTSGALRVIMRSYPDVGGDIEDYGFVEATAIGGVPTYNYNWENAQGQFIGNTFKINNLNYGWYFVTVSDSNTPTCEWIDSVEVQQSIISYDTLQLNHVTCNGFSNGSISVQGIGGEEPYSYRWRHSSWESDSVGNTITNLVAGIYNLTITDVWAFVPTTFSIEITEPNPIGLDAVIVELTECIAPTGIVRASLSPETGAAAPVTYRWSHSGWTTDSVFVDNQFLRNIGVGKYYVTVTDANGCTENDSIEMTDNSPLALQLVPINPMCNGMSNGQITAVVTDPQGTISYSWSHNPTLNSSVALGLAAGRYSLTITDQTSTCQRSADTLLIEPAPIVFTIAEIVKPVCWGDTSGVVVAAISGGSSPYFLEAVNQVTGEGYSVQGNRLENIPPGRYDVRVRDANNCLSSIIEVDLLPIPIQFAITDTVKPTCYGSTDGSITLAITGGSNTYNVFVTEQMGTEYTSNTNVVSGLTGGIYSIAVVDAFYATCSSPDTLTLNLTSRVPHMTANIEIANHPTCNVNSTDGQLRAVVVAGYHPNIPWETQPEPDYFNYQWSNDSTGAIATGFGLGAYSVTVADKVYGCPVVATILVDSARNNIFARASLNPQLIPNHPLTKDSTYCIGDEAGLYSYYQVYGLDGVHVNADAVTWASNNVINNRPVGESVEYYTIAQRNSGDEKFYVTVSYNGCSDTDSLTVRALDLPDVRISAYKIDPVLDGFNGTEPLQSIFTQNQALVKVDQLVSQNTRYIWSERLHTTVQGLTQDNSIIRYSPDTTAIRVQPLDSTIYTVLARTKAYPTREHYCTSTDTALVRVLGEFNPPNAFSPNGDGANDTWKLEGFKQFKSVNVQIYNRWGQLVFESKDPNGEWDGTNKNGKDLPVGTYYYIIDYTTDTGGKKISGPVTIIR